MIGLLLIAATIDARGIPPAEVERWQSACGAVERMLPSAGGWRVRLEQAHSIEQFVRRTGRARFEAAATVGGVIWLQPPSVLGRFGDLAAVRRHECVHARLDALRIRLDRIEEEALAIGLSGQGAHLPPGKPLAKEEAANIAEVLLRPRSRSQLIEAYSRVYATHWPRWAKLSSEALVATLIGGAR